MSARLVTVVVTGTLLSSCFWQPMHGQPGHEVTLSSRLYFLHENRTPAANVPAYILETVYMPSHDLTAVTHTDDDGCLQLTGRYRLPVLVATDIEVAVIKESELQREYVVVARENYLGAEGTIGRQETVRYPPLGEFGACDRESSAEKKGNSSPARPG